MTDARRQSRPAIVKDNVALIPLGVNAKHGYSIVDMDMAWLADEYKWTVDSREKYAVTGTYERAGRRVGMYLHRMIVGVDAGGIINHISRDTFDNRRSNLRLMYSNKNKRVGVVT